MYYELNVSLHGRHFFATAERSITGRKKACDMYWLFTSLFPSSDGYEITVTQRENVGHQVIFTPEDTQS